jgi:hypothetical protein
MTTSANINRPSAPSRREFLNYAFGASIALLTMGSCGGLAWFLQQQRFVDDATSGLFRLDLEKLPLPQASPAFVREAQTYLSNSGNGLIALLGQCPYDRYLVRWSETNFRFECPGCGSKYQLDGAYIEGSAARDLSKGIVRVTTEQGVVITPPDGAPVPVENARFIVVDVKQRIPGTPRLEIALP